MTRTLPSLNALRAFEAAARHRSFTRAAAELNVTQAAVSHQVKGLEERIGTQLFLRLPRALLLTPEAEALLPDLRDAFDRIALAVERVGRQSAGRTLTVSVVTTFALTWLVPRLHRFQERHPDIEVRLSTARHVVDFSREDVDVAVRFVDRPGPDLEALPLFKDVVSPLCGRRYRAQLRTLDDLRRVPLLEMGDHPEWPAWLEGVGLPDLRPRRMLKFDSTKIAVEAAIEGAGVAIGPPELFREEIGDGRLFQPFPQLVESGKSWWLVCPSAAAQRPKIKAFRQWIEDELARDRAPTSRAKRPATSA